MRPVHVIPAYVFKSHINYIFQASFPTKILYASLSSTPYMSHALLTITLLHLITQISQQQVQTVDLLIMPLSPAS
jgi:hypothetical protein